LSLKRNRIDTEEPAITVSGGIANAIVEHYS
jgi:hypothetical protein